MLKFSNFKEETSLQYHDTLNPKLFDLSTQKLYPEVRQALLKFITTWIEFAKISESLIENYYMVGGNANFNYTSQSDIDVHAVFDRRGLGIPTQYLDDYLQDKKALWQAKHHATVRGYSLEPYAQDISERFPLHQGVYSLTADDWIIKPVRRPMGEGDPADSPIFARKVAHFRDQIRSIIHHHGTPEAVEQLMDCLWKMRASGLEKAGEFAIENLVFKELRNLGLIDDLKAYQSQIVDSSLSLD